MTSTTDHMRRPRHALDWTTWALALVIWMALWLAVELLVPERALDALPLGEDVGWEYFLECRLAHSRPVSHPCSMKL